MEQGYDFFSGENMTGGYGGADIIHSCTINVNRGEIVAILGPNGAGKSTAMKAMLGLLNLKEGKVSINGKDISKLNPQDRVKEGISFVPQTRNVFTGLSVQENLEMGAYLREERIEEIINEIYELFPVLKRKKLPNSRRVIRWSKTASCFGKSFNDQTFGFDA